MYFGIVIYFNMFCYFNFLYDLMYYSSNEYKIDNLTPGTCYRIDVSTVVLFTKS